MNTKTAFSIQPRRIFTPETFSGNQTLSVRNGRIDALGMLPLGHDERIVAPAYDLVPGFVELQINGAFGYDFTLNPEDMWATGKKLPELGITSFLATIVTSPPETVQKGIHSWLNSKPDNYRGAEVLGMHIEGPFLNPTKKGAHREEYLRAPQIDLISGWSPENGIRLVTLAPELPGAQELIEVLSKRGVIVSAGHSMATTEEARAGFKAGIKYGTHLFNVMPAMTHREPGLIGALLADDELTVGLIVDGIHVAQEIVKLVWRTKGPERLTLVTDAMAALGEKPGRYHLAGKDVIVNENGARLPDSTLAGSILKPSDALRNLQQFTGCGLDEGLQCWTTTPAKVLGLRHKGRIQPGVDADLVLLDEKGRVAATWVQGVLVYQAPWAELEITKNYQEK